MKSRNNDEEQSMEEILASIRRIISEDDKNVKLDDVIDLHPNREPLNPEFTDIKIDENILHLTEDELEVTSDNSGTEKIISDEISAEVIKTLKLLLVEMKPKKACAIVAEIYGVKKNALYDIALSFKV